MAIDRAGALIVLIREHRLLEPAQLEELSRTPDALDTPAPLLGQCLIELGWLTPYQVDRLIQQRPQELILGSYHLLDRLGQGENGPVFQARKPGKGGTVALKTIPKARLADPQMLSQFQQEVRTAAQLQHPNIAPVSAVGVHGNLFLFAREFVPGADLCRMVRELGPLPPFLACNAVRQAALALQCSHDKGLSHRRVQASNLIVVDQPNGEATVKLVDFGLGQLTAGASAGLDVPGDLAALGQTLAFLVTGQTSLSASGLPAEVAEIVRRFAPDAVDRFNSAWEAAHALEPLCHEPPPAAPATLKGDSMAPAVEPAEIPIASAAVAAVPVEAATGSVSCGVALEAKPQAIELAEPLEGVAVPVMGTVGVAVGPEEPTVAPPPPEPESPPAISVEAAPEVLTEVSPHAEISEPALAETPVVGSEKSDDEWAPLQNFPKNEPPMETAPAVLTEATPPPMASPLSDHPEPMPSAPYSEPSPAGFFTDQSAQSTAVATEQTSGYPMGTATEPAAPRAPTKRKWSKRDIMWVIVGALLWVVVGILVVIIIAIRSNRAEPPKHRPNVPGKSKAKSRAQLIDASEKRRDAKLALLDGPPAAC